ncbi:hypothetical protein [Streptomyces sp. NPDC047725]|uniref:hypothetical protein n=1 Tax=Streptomyces sp. NPDC047725 TaxID=3365487 RepID=UPI003718C70E
MNHAEPPEEPTPQASRYFERDLRPMTRINLALYAAFALMLEDMRGQEVLPVGRRGPAHEAVEGNLAVQLRNLERQAGVRRTL